MHDYKINDWLHVIEISYPDAARINHKGINTTYDYFLSDDPLF